MCVRALTYATLFVGLVLVFVPARLLSWVGVTRPEHFGLAQIVGMVIAAAGVALAAWCVLTFARAGRGTPAPFDPPRRLVVAGPYRFVRNPMYVGAGLALGGAALFYHSLVLVAYLLGLLVAAHLFVLFHEEPALQRSFGAAYTAYRASVPRWLPKA